MIITESEHSDAKSTVRSGDSEAPPSPPPYTPTMSSRSFGADEKPLPTPPFSPPSEFPADHDSDFSTGPTPPPNLPPRCNNLIERNQNSSVKGVWHVDTAMSIPEALLAPLDEFDGTWNEADQKTRKERRKLEKKGKYRSGASPIPSPNALVRPNLMLHSKNGAVSAEVHVVSSDGRERPTLVVAESQNGSVTLEVREYAGQPLRIFATSNNGSVRVRIPQSFEGAVTMSTQNGSMKISDPVKSRLTTFSSASNTTRGFIGDWQASQFGADSPSPSNSASLDPNADPPLPTISDPFAAWAGPLVHIASRNGGVQLAFSDEAPPATEGGGPGLSSAFRGFMSGLFGGGEEGEAGGSHHGGRGRGRGGPWRGRGGPWGAGGGPWGAGGGPWGPGAGPWGGNGGPWGGPFGRGGGPFGPGGGPFGRGGGPFGRGGGFGGGCRSRRGEGPSDDKDAWPSDNKVPEPQEDSTSNYQDEHRGDPWIGMART
ncbi:hypothetical protein BDV93DRAFT_546026 [Ceratobasidium sp. AG-I]|nr:hypothetical protein BDV93DRAFT_546026 [Ceratobasidium sp. AG-I]